MYIIHAVRRHKLHKVRGDTEIGGFENVVNVRRDYGISTERNADVGARSVTGGPERRAAAGTAV